MESNITLHIIKSLEIYKKASEFIINWLRLYHNITQKALVLLSGGSAVQIYKDLANFIDKSELDFSFLAFAQIDERFQPDKEKDVNAYQIEKTGLCKVCEKKRIPYYLISQAGSLQESAKEYNKILIKLFQEYTYKIAILGIGEDGHTAGLLPGFQKLWDVKKLIVGYKNDGEFNQRISMTLEALKQVDQAIVVANRMRKRRVIKNLLDDKFYPELDSFPASIIRSIQKSDLFFSVQN